MSLVERVRNILFSPKMEWETIKNESSTPNAIFTGYVLPLSLIPAIVALLSGLMWTNIRYGILMLIATMIVAAIGYYIGIYVTDSLAVSFSSTKNIEKSAQLVGYSYTATAVAGLLQFIPGIGILAGLAGFVYSAYLMYLGVGPLKDTPEEKKAVYVIVVIVVQFVIGLIIGSIIAGSYLARHRALPF